MSGKATVGLSAWLALLVLGAVVPVLLFAAMTLLEISKTSQAKRDQGQVDTARALALAVDGEVRSWKAALTALAASRGLQQGRLAEFYEEARQVSAQHEGWIVLTDATEQQIMNTLRPYGDPLPKTSSAETIRAIFRDGKPVVTDLFFGKVAQRFIVAVAVPVFREGKVIYALDMSFAPQRLTRLLEGQQLQSSWVAGIKDRQHRVVARSREAERRVGQQAPGWLSAASATADSGIQDGPLSDGRRARVAFYRLQEVPWVMVLAVPLSELQSTTPLAIFLLLGTIVGLAAVGVAIYTGRKITAPVSRLAAAGATVLRGEAVDLGSPSGIREVQELQQAFVEASAAVRAYYHEREQAAVAVERAKVATAAEQALRESQERLQLFIENAPAAIAMFDRDMRYLAVSRRWMTDYGLGDRDIVGRSHYEVFPEIPDAWKIVHQHGLAGKVVQATEDRFERMDGTVQWLRWEVRPWHRGDGTVGGIILFTEDITDRKRTEEEIRNLAKFPDENPSPVMRATADGTILYANLASLPLLEAWGTGKDQTLPYPWGDTVQQALGAGSPREIEVDSGGRVYLIHLVPIRVEGYVNLYGRDITERKRTEEILRTLNVELERKVGERTTELSDTVERLQGEVAQRQQAEAHLQRANRVLRMLSACNEAVVRNDDENQLMQEICRIAVDIGGYRMAWVGLAEDDADKSVRPVASAGFEAGYLEAARISWADTERGRGPTGTAIRLGEVQIGADFMTEPRLGPWRAEAIKRGFRSSIGLPLRQGQSVVGALTIYAAELNAFRDAEVKVLRDLAEDLDFGIMAVRMRTALRDSRDRLRALTAELTLAEQRERRRVAEVLHGDLQQLLVGAKLLVSPLAQAADPAVRDACREATDLILQAIQSSRSLTEELSPPILHRGNLVPALGWLARWMGDKYNLAVVLRVNGKAVVETEETAVLVFQAIRELLLNAVKHAKVETAQVELTRHENQVQIIVSDAGVGLDPAQLRVAGGSAGGFGLFSIHERLELLGGRMEIESAPGQGSRFTLWVPAQRVRAAGRTGTIPVGAEELPGAVEGAGTGPSGRRERKVRVLVVDDHLVVRQGLVRLLKEEPDIEVVGEASDGRTAVALTRQLVPDVVTMDIDLPEMSGIEATRLIHAEFPSVRVIGLSVFGGDAQAAAMRDAGAVEYLTKSGASDALVAAIRACRPDRHSPV